MIDDPPGFGAVVADAAGLFANRCRFYGLRPVAPVELDVERAIGVRRVPTPPDHGLFTVVRRGDRHVTERQIVALPTCGSWAFMWKSARETVARALWEQTTALGYLSAEDEADVMTIGSEADAFSLAFNVEKPFAVTWRGMVHVYYRTVERVPTEQWICGALIRERFYDSLPMLSERYVERILAEDDSMALALEAGK